MTHNQVRASIGSDKTFAFARWASVAESEQLLGDGILYATSEACYGTQAVSLREMRLRPHLNMGVFAVNLRRFRELNYRARIFAWIRQHNECKVWQGGSQPAIRTEWVISMCVCV